MRAHRQRYSKKEDGRERDIERWEGEGGNTGRTQSGQLKDAGLGPKDCRRSEARIRKEGQS